MRTVAAIPADKRTDLQKYLADKFAATFQISTQDLRIKYPELRTEIQALQRELTDAQGKLKAKPHVRVLADNEEPSIPFLLQRGDPVGFGDPVEPGVPSVLQRSPL